MDYSRSKHQAALNMMGPQLFNQPKGIKMKAPLTVEINVAVKDADGKVCYTGAHAWPGMSEAAEVEFIAALQNAVTDLGRAKVAGKAAKS